MAIKKRRRQNPSGAKSRSAAGTRERARGRSSPPSPQGKRTPSSRMEASRPGSRDRAASAPRAEGGQRSHAPGTEWGQEGSHAEASRSRRKPGAAEGGEVDRKQLEELLYQSLETERGGLQVYETALRCVQNDDLKEEWQEYLEQTRNHERIVLEVCEKLGLDPAAETAGRKVVRHIGQSLVKAMEMALEEGEPAAAELVAAECVVLAETKDHMDWELIGEVAKKAKGEDARALKEAHDEVEDEEDEHLYHSSGWARELWIQALGMPAVIPPPEEEKDVKTAIGASRAKQSRKKML